MAFKAISQARRSATLGVRVLVFVICTIATLASAQAASLTVGRELDADSLDPHKDGSTRSMQATSLLFDTLLTMDRGGSIHPGIADAWTVTDDGLTYTFTIRPGVVCHNGALLDASAVKASLDRAIDPATSNPNRPAWGPIAGTAASGTVVTVRLSERFEPFAAFLTSTPSAIVCPASFAADPFQPIGTGPFKLLKWVRNDRIELEANTDYRNYNPLIANSGRPHIDSLTLRVIPEAVVRMAALRSGEVDMADPSIEDAGSFLTDPDFGLYAADLTGELLFAGFTWRVPPLDNPDVRKAIAHALNRQSYADIAFAGLNGIADCPVAPALFAFDPRQCATWGAAYNPAGAKSLLAKAGYGPGRPLAIRLLGPAREGWSGMYQIIQQDLAAIGVEAEIDAREATAFFHLLATANSSAVGKPTLWLSGISGVDPNYLFFLWKRPGFVNMGINAELDALLEAQRVLSGAARADKIHEIEKYLLTNSFMVPLLTPGWSWMMAHANRVQGFKMGFMASLIFNDVKIIAK